ncbi:MAG: hypothetical protein CMH55_06870 [Myxococcales bacterium]|nr:hypothetical protein [Myxococcales bacterium]
MQVRHTNGKIYAVPDVPTLIKWIQDRRLARRCMVRFDDAEWMPILDIPEAADAFDALEAATAPEEPPPATTNTLDPEPEPEPEPESITDSADEDLDALAAEAEQLVADPEFADDFPPATDDGNADFDEGPGPIPDIPSVDDAVEEDLTEAAEEPSAGAAEGDDPFDMINSLGGDSPDDDDDDLDDDDLDDDDLDDDDFDDEEGGKKSKLPLMLAVLALLGGGGYFAFSGGGGGGGFGADVTMDPTHEKLISNGIVALLSGDRANMAKALVALGPAVCQGECGKMKQCVEAGEETKVCGPSPKAAAYVPAFLLADRLWRETATHMRVDASLKARLDEVNTLTSAVKAEGEFQKAHKYVQRAAFIHYYNATHQPNKKAEVEPIYQSLLGDLKKEDSSGNTMLFLALQAIDTNDIASAERFIKSAESPAGGGKADAGLMLFAKARLERARAKDKCDNAKAAYKAADEASLGFATREGALFLASKGDLAGAAELIGASAGSDPILNGLKLAPTTPAPKTIKELKNATFKKWVKNRRGRIFKFYKKKIYKPQRALETNSPTSLKLADLLEQGHSLFPYQVADLVRAGWLTTFHVEEEGLKPEAKTQRVEKAKQRFDKVLALDPGNREALLGKAGLARFGGKDEDGAQAANFYAWLFLSHEGLNAGTCAPPPPATPAPEAAPATPKKKKKRGKRRRRRGRRR